MTRYHRSKSEDGRPVFSPPFPAELLEPESETLWYKVWEFGAGIYQASDFQAVLRYCELTFLYDKCLAEVVQFGVVEPGSQGQNVESTASKVLGRLVGQLQSLEDRLGLSPRAASEIGLGEVKSGAPADSELAEFLRSDLQNGVEG